MSFAERLALACRRRRLTYAQLGRKCGVPIQTIHGWSKGRPPSNAEQLKQIALALEWPLYDLLFGERDPFQNVLEEGHAEFLVGDVTVTIRRRSNGGY